MNTNELLETIPLDLLRETIKKREEEAKKKAEEERRKSLIRVWCPRCDGRGMVPVFGPRSAECGTEEPCPACDGKKIVEARKVDG